MSWRGSTRTLLHCWCWGSSSDLKFILIDIYTYAITITIGHQVPSHHHHRRRWHPPHHPHQQGGHLFQSKNSPQVEGPPITMPEGEFFLIWWVDDSWVREYHQDLPKWEIELLVCYCIVGVDSTSADPIISVQWFVFPVEGWNCGGDTRQHIAHTLTDCSHRPEKAD